MGISALTLPTYFCLPYIIYHSNGVGVIYCNVYSCSSTQYNRAQCHRICAANSCRKLGSDSHQLLDADWYEHF